MKTNKKLCDKCGELRLIWKNESVNGVRSRYCKECWSCRKAKVHKPTLNRKPLRARSPKRAKQEAQYNKECRAFKEKHPNCKAALLGVCTGYTQDVHHKGGRIGDDLLDQSMWLPVCRSCHEWIENHLTEAKELGLSISKVK